jgi:hypothetical protein
MARHTEDAKALKVAKQFKNADNWKHLARWHGGIMLLLYYAIQV